MGFSAEHRHLPFLLLRAGGYIVRAGKPLLVFSFPRVFIIYYTARADSGVFADGPTKRSSGISDLGFIIVSNLLESYGNIPVALHADSMFCSVKLVSGLPLWVLGFSFISCQ